MNVDNMTIEELRELARAHLKLKESMKNSLIDWKKQNKDKVAINNRNYNQRRKERLALEKEALKNSIKSVVEAQNPENASTDV